METQNKFKRKPIPIRIGSLFRLGPATVLAIVAAATVAYYSDSKPRPVARVTAIPAPNKPLSKPEPSLLLEQEGLNLSVHQRMKLTRICSDWETKKASLLKKMSEFSPKQGRVDEISAGLGEYSRLSRDFDAVRSAMWQHSLAVLSAIQREKVQL